MHSSIHRWVVSLSIVLLAACGGGSGSTQDSALADASTTEDSTAPSGGNGPDQPAIESDAPNPEESLPESLQPDNTATEQEMALTGSDNLVTAATSTFEGTYTRMAPGWTVNWWGDVQWNTARETRSGYIHGGTSSLRFKVGSRASGANAHLIYPYGFVSGRTYRVVVYLRTDSAASVDVQLRRDAAPWNVAARKTVTLGSGWTRVELEGEFLWDSPGSVRIVSKTVGANIYVDDMTLLEEGPSGSSGALAVPASGGSSTSLKTVASTNFDEAFTYTASGWKFNYWGAPTPTFEGARETRSGYVQAGSASQRFRTNTAATNEAHLIYPFAFVKGRTYRASVHLRSDVAAKVEVMMRRDAHPWDGFGRKTVSVGTSWQKVEVQGVYSGDVGGSLRIISKTPGANIWIDSMTLSEVSYNDLAPVNTGAIPSTMFGVHVNKLGTHFNWPTLGQGIVRLWNTGTTWRDLEKSNNVWDFSNGNGKRLELYVDYVSKNGGQMLYTLGQTPQWASSNPSVTGLYGAGAPMPPSNMEDWRDYVRTLARRYSGKIKYWELWNESDYSGTYAGSVEKMVEMARIAREELKAADPNNVLVSPGLTTGQGVAWLDRFLAAGGGAHVDNIGFHWYYSMQPEKIAASIQNVREVMRNHGVDHKPLWNTEGAPLCNSAVLNCATWVPSAAEQRSVNARAALIMWAKGVSNFNYYFWENGEPQRKLVHTDNVTPTTASHAYAEAIRWMKGARVTDAFRVADSVYVFRMNRGTENYSVMWSTKAGQAISVPSAWGASRVRNLAGQESGISGGVITLGLEPVLVK